MRPALLVAFAVLITMACTNGSAPLTACVAAMSSCEALDAGLLECTTFGANAECLDFFYVSTTNTRIECGCVRDVTTCLARVDAVCNGEAGAGSD
jgi:hypothetical protein